jgi:tetratricopeptide (TPR) repeat protein
MPTVDAARQSSADLSRTRSALEAALRLRPHWAEGHLRLGAVLLGLYSNRAQELVSQVQDEKDPESAAILSDPLWLHKVIHSVPAKQLAEVGSPLEHEPVRDYLVPAAYCFLQARRCSPDLALTHARLAELDYLLDAGETTSVHAARALRLCGYDSLVVALAGQAAAQAEDLRLAARCWQKALAIHEDRWEEIVLAAAMVMTPQQILDQVLPAGARLPLLVADQLYAEPESREAREQFLKASADRAPRDPGLSTIERLWVEGQARALLDQRQAARDLMTRALRAGDARPEWREEFIGLLIAWGDLEEASRQARIGAALYPGNPASQRAHDLIREAYARGQ